MSRKKTSNSASFQYHLNSSHLESAPHTTDLGVIVSSSLTWLKHIEDMCAKANET